MTTRMAVVGCGHLGAIHARLLAARADVTLVAVVDPLAEQRERVAAAHGCAAWAEPGALVGQVDAAVIAAPTGLHAAVALPLLEAGIDLLVEKPLAASVEDARAIVAPCRSGMSSGSIRPGRLWPTAPAARRSSKWSGWRRSRSGRSTWASCTTS